MGFWSQFLCIPKKSPLCPEKSLCILPKNFASRKNLCIPKKKWYPKISTTFAERCTPKKILLYPKKSSTLANPSLLETDPQILEHWGYADEDHLGKSFQTMDSGLECQHDVTRPSNRTHQIGFCMSELFRKIDENFGLHILIYATQLSCNFQLCHCTFVTILFRPFARPFISLAMRIRALFPKSASIFRTCRTHSGGCHFSQNEVVQVDLSNPCRAIETFFPLGLLPLGLLVPDAFFTLCCVEDLGERFGCVIFARLLISCWKLQLSPLEHCPLAFHCQQSPRLLCPRCFPYDS